MSNGTNPRVFQKPSIPEISSLEHNVRIKVFAPPKSKRKTGIIGTIGPSVRSMEQMKKLFAAGLNIARMNFSHGTHEFHKESLDMLRKAEQEYREQVHYAVQIAAALDTKGPEIRTGIIEGDDGTKEVDLVPGEPIRITTDIKYKNKCSSKLLYIDYENMPKVVKGGNRVLIADGVISLKIEKVNADGFIDAVVEYGGKIGSKKGCNLPDVAVDLPALSEQDKKDLAFAAANDFDMVFASFVRNADGVRAIRAALGDKASQIKVIAKIENRQGLDNIDEIISEADGIMVARGDLGVEIPPEKVFLAQKLLCAKGNKANKSVIVATQMLESMILNSRPTRAEVSDVANAVLDGCDCVMLSGETAKGKFPIEAVKMQDVVCREAEDATYHKRYFDEIRHDPSITWDQYYSMSVSAVEASIRCKASAIICLTSSGRGAYTLSMFHPKAMIVAATREKKVARQMHLYRGIIPLHIVEAPNMQWEADYNLRIRESIKAGRALGFIKDGDALVVFTGYNKGAGNSHSVRIIFADEKEENGYGC